MDPFTQRMLERASARREKLNTLLSNTGHDVSSRRSPLKDANAILAQAPVITGHIAKSPSKFATSSASSSSSSLVSPTKTVIKKVSSPQKSPQKTPKKSEEQRFNKENGDQKSAVSSLTVKSKLQRLGKLYSDDHAELSSPIQRTEEKFAVEDNDNERRSAKASARLNRLAALASEINNWEDDLSHPSIIKPGVSKAEKIHAKMNEQVKNASDPQPSTSGYNSRTNSISDSPKTSRWEKTVSESLGSERSPIKASETRLGCRGLLAQKSPAENANKTTPSKSSPKNDSTSEKAVKSGSSVSNTRLNSRFGYNSSPKACSSKTQSPGSVLSKASIFESKNSGTKTKDPAEMTLSERKALFERNKGEALIPKAPLTMSVPTKMLKEKEKSSPAVNEPSPRPKNDTGRAVGAQRSIFEQGIRTQELENNILQTVQAERQRELEMLRSRFNKNREAVQSAVSSNIRTSESSEGKPSSPKNSPVCQVKPRPATDQIPPPPPLPTNQKLKTPVKSSPVKRQVVGSPPKSNEYKSKTDVKRIKVAQPQSGRLYPDLNHIESTTDTEYTVNSTEEETATVDDYSDTETGTEAEYYLQDRKSYDDYEYDSDEDIGNTSLGRSILNVVNQQKSMHKKRCIEPDPDSTSEISVLDEMDEYLDECLALQEDHLEGPTPPKINKSLKSPSTSTRSFRYQKGPFRSPIKVVTPKSSPLKSDSSSSYINEGNNRVPLLHSISTYRKQQSQTPKTPIRSVTTTTEDEETSFENSSEDKESVLVQEKVKRLLDDVGKQQTIIGQASQALNLCTSTVEFSGSREQVEGERLLLVASHRRQAALNEIQRLKVEGCLRPVTPGASEVQESGCLTISAITLPLKRDAFRGLEQDACIHFVCLIRNLETVIATPVVQAQAGDSCVRFPSTLKLQDLFSDFKVTIEVYTLHSRAEILPHEIKYHIHGSNGASSAKKSSGKTPKKLLKHETKLVMPNVQSPAGPTAVRTTSFSLAGYVIFSLKEVHRQQFTLNKLLPDTPLEGRLQMHVSCELTVSVEHHGFLTMFEDVSGFGAWHRRWCLLKGATLSYWKYPDDEKKKTPIGSLDLQSVTTVNVGLVSRDICARPNTFLLESSRPSQPGDTDSLVMITNGSETTIRHLLSADTKEDRLEWCSRLNKTLHLLRMWGGSS